MNAIVLSLLVAPHILLGFAWILWVRSSKKAQSPRWRTTLLFFGMVSCSLNIAIFWSYVIWLRFQQMGLSWWKGLDVFEDLCSFLIVFALLAAVFGKGRERLLLFFSAVTGYLIWLVGHVAIL